MKIEEFATLKCFFTPTIISNRLIVAKEQFLKKRSFSLEDKRSFFTNTTPTSRFTRTK